MKRRKRRVGTGTCWLCKDEPDDAPRGLGSRCYSSVRFWSAKKTEAEREKRIEKLLLYQTRLNALNEGLIKINHITETANDKVRRNVRHSRAVRSSTSRKSSSRGHSRSRSRGAPSTPAPSTKAVH